MYAGYTYTFSLFDICTQGMHFMIAISKYYDDAAFLEFAIIQHVITTPHKL